LRPRVRAVELRRIADALNAEADRLDGGYMTTQQAAEVIGRSEENLRQWVRRFGIGHFDSGAHRYVISRSKLTAHMLAAYGPLPHGLAGRF
jgi:excisionase family DNA binding protein